MIRRRTERKIGRLAELLRLGLMCLDLKSVPVVIRAEPSHGRRLTSCELWTTTGEGARRICDLPGGADLTIEMVEQAIVTTGLFRHIAVGNAQWTASPGGTAVELDLTDPGGRPGPELVSTTTQHADGPRSST
ncbi:hypothetical protein GCM10027059_49960 [Myceligenerans halotolerans]